MTVAAAAAAVAGHKAVLAIVTSSREGHDLLLFYRWVGFVATTSTTTHSLCVAALLCLNNNNNNHREQCHVNVVTVWRSFLLSSSHLSRIANLSTCIFARRWHDNDVEPTSTTRIMCCSPGDDSHGAHLVTNHNIVFVGCIDNNSH